MSYFAKNIAALEQVNSMLAQSIKETKHDGSFLINHDGAENLKVSIDGKHLTFSQELLGDKLPRLVGGVASGFGRFILLAGVGTGKILKEVLAAAHTHSRVLLLEPSIQLLLELMHKEDLSTQIADRRLRIFVAENPVRRLYEEVELWFGPSEKPDIRLVKSGSSIACFPKWQKIVAASVEELLSKSYRSGGSAVVSALWQRNIFKNFHYATSSLRAASLYGCLGGRPVVVVTDSPLLEQQADSLKRIAGHVLIVAELAATRRLKKIGIRADLVTSVDSYMGSISARHDEVHAELEVLVASIASHPFVMQNHSGSVIMTGSPDPLSRWLERGADRFGLSCFGNDADMALRFAASLGCSPIFLMGDGGRYSVTLNSMMELLESRPDGSLQWMDGTDDGLGMDGVPRVKLKHVATNMLDSEPMPKFAVSHGPAYARLERRLAMLGADAGRVRCIAMRGVQAAVKAEGVTMLGGAADGRLAECGRLLSELLAYGEMVDVCRFRFTDVYERLHKLEAEPQQSAREAACYLAIFRSISRTSGDIDIGIQDATSSKGSGRAVI